jgi:hypothetical protein
MLSVEAKGGETYRIWQRVMPEIQTLKFDVLAS